MISQGRDDIGDDTAIRFVKSETKEEELTATVDAIEDYVSGRYFVRNKEVRRPVEYGDIAVICRKTEHCRLVRDKCAERGIPAYLQGEVQIMRTREGKLALAWLRFVNNERDPWAYITILTDMGYAPTKIKAVSENYDALPKPIRDQRDSLYRKRRRITDLLTSLFEFYHLDNDITQAIITTMSSVHRGSLLTISDVIRIIEDDIERKSTYPVENFIDTRAVTIMTMHKAKGLEFPVVICPFIDAGTIPSTRGDTSEFLFDKYAGIRCTKEIGRFGDYLKICTSWRTKLAKSAVPKEYDEERRLMFVALSRAKQFETLICGPEPSQFMKSLSAEDYTKIPKTEKGKEPPGDNKIDMPVVPKYPARRRKVGVHEILDFGQDGQANYEGCDEVCGKGTEYGTTIHKIAEIMCHGFAVNEEEYPELAEVRKVLDGVKEADILYPEIECGLPIEGLDVTLRGVIDLLAVYPDHIEVHDYKTDVSDRFEHEYEVQLSVYAYAAELFYKKPVDCYIDYVSRGIVKEVSRIPMEEIARRVGRYVSDVYNDE